MASESGVGDIGKAVDEGRWSGLSLMVLALTTAALVVDGLDNNILSIAIPALTEAWDTPRAAFGSVASLSAAGMGVGAVAAGLIGDRMGRRFGMLLSVFLFASMTMCIAFVTNVTELGIVRFLAGVGLGGLFPNATSIVAEFTPVRHRSMAISLSMVALPGGAIIAGLLGGLVLEPLGWQSLFVIAGGISLAMGVALLVFLPESPSYLARRPERADELAALCKRLGIRSMPVAQSAPRTPEKVNRFAILFGPDRRLDTFGLWGAFFLIYLMNYTLLTWMPSLLRGSGLSLAMGGWALIAAAVGGILAPPLTGYFLERSGSRSLLLACAAAGVAGALIMSQLPLTYEGMVAFLILAAFESLFISTILTALYATATHVYPSVAKATGVGAAASMARLGGVVSGAGVLVLDAGGSVAFFGMIAACALGIFLATLLVRHHITPVRAWR